MTTGPGSPAAAQVPGRGARVLDWALSGLLRLPGRARQYQVERGLRVPARDRWLTHPDRADPTVGGRLLPVDAGVHDNRALEARPDVLTFTTPPLESALEVTGVPVVELSCSRDNPFADVFARLCDVDPRGRSRNFSDAFRRLDPAPPGDDPSPDDPSPPSAGEPEVLRLELDPCARRLAPGHRLRLQVSGGSFPRFTRNEGTGAAPGAGTDLRPCTHTGYHTTGAASRVILPVSP